jgi:ketosteroid isomerase-like protein
MNDAAPARPVDDALLGAINDAFNSRDLDRIMSFFAEDATFLMASGPEAVGRTVRGKAAIAKVLGDRFKVIPDMRWDHVHRYVSGNRAVTVWRVRGHAQDGTVLDYQGCDLYEFRDGLIFHKDTYWKNVQRS